MTTILVRVLLTLAFVAITSAKICTLCPKGGKPRNGNALLFEGQDAGILVTCNELAKEIITNSDGEFCDDPFAHAFQVVCGCPGVKAGPCPGICSAGFTLAEPSVLADDFDGLTCSVADQFLRGTPGDTCGTTLARNDKLLICVCKEKVKPSQNMGGGAGMGMNGMAGGRKLRFGGLEERFTPRVARGLAM